MAGTSEGAAKAVQTTKKKHGDDFYSKAGKKGAEKYRERQDRGVAKPRGFAANPELASKAGAMGGKVSKRGKANK